MDTTFTASERRIDGDRVITVVKGTHKNLPLWNPPPQPSQDQNKPGFIARIFRRDGSYGTPVAEPLPTPVPPSGAILALRAATAQLHELRKQIGDIHNRAASHHTAEQHYAAAVAALQQLERVDVDTSAQHTLDGSHDATAQERAQAITDAEQRAVAALRAKQIGAAAIKRSNADAQRIQTQVAELEQHIKSLTRAALVETLAAEAPLLKRTAEMHYAQSVRAFAICRALTGPACSPGEHYGAGSENHLTLPTPTHPAFNFRTVPSLYADIQAETTRILEELKA
jgi:hypothetical protein